MAFKKTFKKNKFVAIFVYWVLAIRGLVVHRIMKRSLKTGERAKHARDMSNYVQFCLTQFNILGFYDEVYTKALEIGPGDSAALAEEIFRLKNCTVDLIDKYQNVCSGHEANSDDVCGIRWITSTHAFPPAELLLEKQYDLIYSVSVIEHLWPWKKALREYVSCLTPDAVMYHIVNFTDHGLFTPFHDPFMFRRVPRLLYEPAMRPVGRPNRALPSDLCKFFEDLGFRVDVRVLKTHTRVLNPGELYSLQSIPDAEMSLLSARYTGPLDLDEFILDQCIGSAVFRVQRND